MLISVNTSYPVYNLWSNATSHHYRHNDPQLTSAFTTMGHWYTRKLTLLSLNSRQLGAGVNVLFYFYLNFSFFSNLFIFFFGLSSVKQNIINSLLFLPFYAGPVKPTIFLLFLKHFSWFLLIKKQCCSKAFLSYLVTGQQERIWNRYKPWTYSVTR